MIRREVQQKILGVPIPPMSDTDLQRVFAHLTATLARDALVQETTDKLREFLLSDRVVLYYFYRKWEGRVTYESLSSNRFSIFGATGPDECFNGEYAAMYEARRVRAIADIETEPIAICHRDFLRSMQIRANLVVPVLNNQRLWGLLIAHQCQATRSWTPLDIEAMQKAAKTLATAPSIQDS